MRDHPFIVLEGTSGTGKSSVATLLAARIGGVVMKTPAPPLAGVREVIDRGMATVEGRHLFYLATVVEVSGQIKEQLKVSPVVCDRYLLSTECYHRALGTKVEVDLAQLDLVTPDLTVLLTCEQTERLRRIQERGWSYNDLEEERLGVTEAFQQEYLKHPVFVIETLSYTPGDIVSAILDRLSED